MPWTVALWGQQPALTVYSWSSCLSGGRCCCCAMRPRNILSCSLYASWFVFVPGASKFGAAAVMNCEQVEAWSAHVDGSCKGNYAVTWRSQA